MKQTAESKVMNMDFDEKKLQTPKKIMNKKVTQTVTFRSKNKKTSENKLKCELVKEDMGLKVVRLYE